jgi:hypothetical protein
VNQGVQGANGALDLSGSPASPKWLSGKSSTVQLNWCAGGCGDLALDGEAP